MNPAPTLPTAAQSQQIPEHLFATTPAGNFPAPGWQGRMLWVSGAIALHIAAIALMLTVSPVTTHPIDIMSVSLLPMAPPAATPPAPQPKAQPVVQKQVRQPVTTPKQPVTQSETALSQPQQAAAPSSSSASQSNQPASGSGKPGNDVPFTPANNAAYLNNPRPAYPNMSRRLGEQGTVVYEVHVLATGLPSEVKVAKSSGFQRLDEAGRETILKYWRFEPARRGGEAVAQTVTIPMPFVLEK